MAKQKYKAKYTITTDEVMRLRANLWKKVDSLYSTNNDIQRRIINESTISPSNWFRNFFASIGHLTSPGVSDTIAWLDSVSKDGVTTTQNVIDAWNDLSKYMSGAMELGHGDWSVVGSRCLVIYKGLLLTYEEVIAINADPNIKEKVGGNVSKFKVIDLNKYFYRGKFKDKAWTEKMLKQAVEDSRRCWVIAIKISQLPAGTPVGESLNDLKELVRDYLNPKNQEQHTIIKNTGVDVVTGKAELDLRIETTQLNEKVKAPLEYRLGTALNEVMRKSRTAFLKEFDTFPWENLVGSKAIGSEIVKQLSDLAVGKIPKPSRSNTILKQRGSTKAIKTPHVKKLLSMPKELKAIKRLPKVSVEGKEPTDPQLRYRIQQGLRKRLQQHMHRPALIYRSGRFAKSVKLLTLTENEKGELYGKYTYQLNPYQTFENTGIWPSGYNPKPLITKVIRELAQEKAEKRIAYLRRT